MATPPSGTVHLRAVLDQVGGQHYLVECNDCGPLAVVGPTGMMGVHTFCREHLDVHGVQHVTVREVGRGEA